MLNFKWGWALPQSHFNYTAMVNIKSFCFTDGYTKIEAVITIPSQMPDGFKLTKVIIGT